MEILAHRSLKACYRPGWTASPPLLFLAVTYVLILFARLVAGGGAWAGLRPSRAHNSFLTDDAMRHTPRGPFFL